VSGDTWADDDGALAFLKMLKGQRQAAWELLVSVSSKTTDPNVRSAWASLMQLERTIDQMEAERGKPDE